MVDLLSKELLLGIDVTLALDQLSQRLIRLALRWCLSWLGWLLLYRCWLSRHLGGWSSLGWHGLRHLHWLGWSLWLLLVSHWSAHFREGAWVDNRLAGLSLLVFVVESLVIVLPLLE